MATVEDLAGFAAAGLEPEAAAVMTARAVSEPHRPQTDADYRALTSDADWRQRVDPTYLAIRLYRSLGFAETETQLQVERPLGPAAARVRVSSRLDGEEWRS